MLESDLQQLWESLVMPLPHYPATSLSAVAIPNTPGHRIGKDTSGSPCLLISQPSGYSPAPPIRLENLQVSFAVPCVVTDPHRGEKEDTFTIVRCSTANPKLFPYFLRIIAPVVASLGGSPTPTAVRRAISGLVELFQALTGPSKKTVQGIWAELLAIRVSTDPRAMVAAWHREPGERFDFSAGPQRLEVKSSSSRQREHAFSLEQITPTGGLRIAVASVFVERIGGGLSVRELFGETRNLVSSEPELVTRFDTVFFSSLGSSWADAMDERFDWELATESILYYGAESVPRPENRTPQSVFDVRFRAQLGSVAPLGIGDLDNSGGLFAAAVPAQSKNS